MSQFQTALYYITPNITYIFILPFQTSLLSLSQVELRADSKILANAMYQSSATIESAAQEAASNNLSMLAGSFGDASVAGDAVAAAINR